MPNTNLEDIIKAAFVLAIKKFYNDHRYYTQGALANDGFRTRHLSAYVTGYSRARHLTKTHTDQARAAIDLNDLGDGLRLIEMELKRDDASYPYCPLLQQLITVDASGAVKLATTKASSSTTITLTDLLLYANSLATPPRHSPIVSSKHIRSTIEAFTDAQFQLTCHNHGAPDSQVSFKRNSAVLLHKPSSMVSAMRKLGSLFSSGGTRTPVQHIQVVHVAAAPAPVDDRRQSFESVPIASPRAAG